MDIARINNIKYILCIIVRVFPQDSVGSVIVPPTIILRLYIRGWIISPEKRPQRIIFVLFLSGVDRKSSH